MKRVIAFGTFDPLHKGHINFLRQAKKLGFLVVIVAHEDKIRLEKLRSPRESNQERIKKVKELNIADEVYLSDEDNDYKILEKINPDVIALGYDQKIPEPLKNKLKKYKIVLLKPFRPDKYKSSLLGM